MPTKILSVAEKPSVAKELARIIGGDGQLRNKAGYSVYNRIYEIDNCQFRGGPAQMSITSVSGHLTEMEFTDAHRSWSSCDPLALFDAPIVEKVGEGSNENIAKTLREEAKKHNTLLLWLDCDLEGEAISFEVMNVCKEANPRLEVYRARFSALIPRDIMRTMAHPERPNSFMNDAVLARKEIDLRIGAAFTRFQTKHIQRKFEALSDIGVISYGPCQFPTLGFIIDRYLKIQQFTTEAFWYLTCDLRGPDPDNAPDGTMVCSFSWDRVRLYDRFACAVLMEACCPDDQDGGGGGGGEGEDTSSKTMAKVYRNDARQTRHHKPVPLNTVELQQRAAKFLNLGSEITMKVAEELYNRGILSYPRTETDFFQDGFDLNVLIDEQRSHTVWGDYAKGLLDDGKFEQPANGGHDDQAHPPIHPLKCVEAHQLNPDEYKIYELVTRHFLACCSKDGLGQQTEIGIIVSDNFDDGGEKFTGKGLMVLERNYLDIYKYDKWAGKKVPLLRVGDVIEPSSFMMLEGRTTAPAPLKEEDLINTMDKNGIGTDATIASHIQTIQERNYAIKHADRSFQPTDLGLALYDAYNDIGYQLTKPYLRATMEADCQKIAKGLLKKEDMLAACIAQMKDCFINCVKNVAKMDAAIAKHACAMGGVGAADFIVETRNFSTCGKCRKQMDLKSRQTANGNTKRIVRCNHCSEQYNVPLPSNSQAAQLEAVNISCPICKFQVVKVTFPNKNPWHFCPSCFANPPGPPDAEDNAQDDFKCFKCAHVGCTLATRVVGAAINIAPCSERQCGGFFKIKTMAKGGYMAVCSNSNTKDRVGCPGKPWYFPKMIRGVSASATETCGECMRKHHITVHKVTILLNRDSAPAGMLLESTICPCCNPLWTDCGERSLPKRTNIVSDDRSVSYQGRNDSRSDSNHHSMPKPVQPQQLMQQPSYQPMPQPMQQQQQPSYQPMQQQPMASDYSAATTGQGFRQMQPVAAGFDASGGAGANPPCKCNVPSVLRTTQKEGPNKGRQFFTCPKPQGEQCGFFLWQDASGGGVGGGAVGGGGFGGNPNVICSRCQGSGHYAKQCPNKK